MYEREKAICIVILYVNPSELDFEIFEPYIYVQSSSFTRENSTWFIFENVDTSIGKEPVRGMITITESEALR